MHRRAAGHCRKRTKETSSCSTVAKKPCSQSILQKYLTASVPDSEESEGESEGEDGDKCMVCGEREDDVDVEDWVACEICSVWIHSNCIPPDHPYSISDADFYCLNS